MKVAIVGAAMALLASQAVAEPFTSKKAPAELTEAEIKALVAAPMTGKGSFCRYAAKTAGKNSQDDTRVIWNALMARGVGAEDMFGILHGKITVGMTMTGVECVAGKPESINKAYYEGVGHNWQVVTSRYGFIYLQGASVSQLRVTGWN